MNIKYFFFLLSFLPVLGYAQFYGFEKDIPSGFSFLKNTVKLSSTYYKEGKKSLQWDFSPNEQLEILLDKPFVLDEEKEKSFGIQLWIYNEQPRQDSLRFEFLSKNGEVSYRFTFKLVSVGWRACWINFHHMNGDKKNKNIAGCRLISPNYKGRVFLDRMTLPTTKYNARTTPDAQMPFNNSLTYRDLWHWCRTWQWEQYAYDIPLKASITQQEKKELNDMESKLSAMLLDKNFPKSKIDKAYELYRIGGIKKSDLGYIGAPLVAPDDDLDSIRGDYSLNNLESMLSGFAYDYFYNKSEEALKKYFTVWDYAIDQGFSYGSGMGTNHHYGYQVQDIYATAWLLRKEIFASRNCTNIIATLQYWSALSETRKSCQKNRDELLDTWHTLLMPKMVSALLFKDERKKIQALKGLTRWVSTSLVYTNGTLGGIKIDGTAFHHGGFYPAYTIGATATLGRFINFVNGTSFALPLSARKVFRSALEALRNYSTMYEWGIGICGRHPFGKYKIEQQDVAAYAYLALAGDMSNSGKPFDYQLAADYLRLCNQNTPEAIYFKKQGVKPAKSPEGFFVYNYGSAGIFRRNDWMVTLKGYNTDVWGAEIYFKDNRYGRYQSYGSTQIFGTLSPETSGYKEDGWDWNRLPGTTTIHLPFNMLNSPNPYSTMLRSLENFSGSSALEGKNGMFAMKLMERDLKNFTPDHTARKSVFCFDNRLICLGSNISNSNQAYPTETTLFQITFSPQKNKVQVLGKDYSEIGYANTFSCSENNIGLLSDGHDNYYFIKKGEVHVQIANQNSFQNKTCAPTKGTFATAWLNHGIAPKNDSYEYLVLIQPSKNELQKNISSVYEVLSCNENAHAVYDKQTGITAYAVFEKTDAIKDKLLMNVTKETMVMYRYDNNSVILSVCDPNLNISEKTYTTPAMSCPINKQLLIKGKWTLKFDNHFIKLEKLGENTSLTITCKDGLPMEFTLIPN